MQKLLEMQIRRAKGQLDQLQRCLDKTGVEDGVAAARIGAELGKISHQLAKILTDKVLVGLGRELSGQV